MTDQIRTDRPTPDGISRMSVVQQVAMAFGVVFLLVGIAGFVPGLTTDVDDMEFVGHESGAQLLGVFQVSILHNAIHIAFGVAGLVLSRHWSWARSFLLGGGAVYLVLLVYGIAVDHDSDANFVPLDDADNWLHAGLGVAMIALGAVLPPRRDPIATSRTSSGGSAFNQR